MNCRKLAELSPKIGQGVYVDEAALIIGDVKLGHNVSVWPGAIIRGDVNHIDIGDECNIQDGCVLHVTHDGPYTPGGYALELGRGVTVGHKVVLHGCKIGDYCLIGMGAIVMDGVTMENEVLVGAGALVTPGTHLPSGTLWRGSPARQARELTEEDRQQLHYSAAHYVRVKNRYLDDLAEE